MGQKVKGRRDPFWDLVATARRLQAPGGCPWDRKQTVASLTPHLIEETWEVFDAVRRRQRQAIREELGDVLYTVLFQALIAERCGQGSLRALLRATRRKMIRRHPHVFGGQKAVTPDEAYRRWQTSKRQEGSARFSPSKAFQQRLVRLWEQLQVPAARHKAVKRGRRALNAAART